MTNLHGALVPVFDLAERWGTVHDPAARPMLLVLGHADERAGIVIDGIPERVRASPEERLHEAPQPSALEGCINAIYQIGGDDWIDLGCSAFLERLRQTLAQ